MTGTQFPDPDEMLREADERDREAEHDAESKQDRGHGDDRAATDEDEKDRSD